MWHILFSARTAARQQRLDMPPNPPSPTFSYSSFRVDKYWPPIGRVDNVFGDRNLICTCPPLESYLDAAE